METLEDHSASADGKRGGIKMERIRRKLKSVRGESLVELLASILIGGLSVTMLATLIITAAHLKESAKKRDKEYYDSLAKAEKQENVLDGVVPPVTVTYKTATGVEQTEKIDVIYYGTDDMVSYKIKETETPSAGGAGG